MIKPIEYDADMDRFYIPVNSQYEIQTKGKGSSFRIANTSTHERMLVADTYLHPMLEDMAKGCNAEYSQLHAQNTQLQADNAMTEQEIYKLQTKVEIMREALYNISKLDKHPAYSIQIARMTLLMIERLEPQ